MVSIYDAQKMIFMCPANAGVVKSNTFRLGFLLLSMMCSLFDITCLPYSVLYPESCMTICIVWDRVWYT